MTRLLPTSALVALLLNGAIFGFFFAWVCSTMWGLDVADPAVAIAAMQAMNASVRNAVFFPAFFLTPVVLVIVAFLARKEQRDIAFYAFGAAAVIYLFGGLILTITINVPMNEALAGITIPDEQAAHDIWQAYSGRWQFWNIIRTVFSGIELLVTGIGLLHLKQPDPKGVATGHRKA